MKILQQKNGIQVLIRWENLSSHARIFFLGNMNVILKRISLKNPVHCIAILSSRIHVSSRQRLMFLASYSKKVRSTYYVLYRVSQIDCTKCMGAMDLVIY